MDPLNFDAYHQIADDILFAGTPNVDYDSSLFDSSTDDEDLTPPPLNIPTNESESTSNVESLELNVDAPPLQELQPAIPPFNSTTNFDSSNGGTEEIYNPLPQSGTTEPAESTSIAYHIVQSTPSVITTPPVPLAISSTPSTSATSTSNNITPSPEASEQPIDRAIYMKVKGSSSQKTRRFPDILPEDTKRGISQVGGKNQLWYYLLHLLGDHTKKSVIVWTGNQRQFKVRNPNLLCHLWSMHNERSDVQWETLRRVMRTTGKNGILMAVPSKKHKGRNEEGVFGFVIEPAFYLGVTREQLDLTIKLHCETGPLTVGGILDSSCGYPVGSNVPVIPMMDLDRDGNPLYQVPQSFATVVGSSANSSNQIVNQPNQINQVDHRFTSSSSNNIPSGMSCPMNGVSQPTQSLSSSSSSSSSSHPIIPLNNIVPTTPTLPFQSTQHFPTSSPDISTHNFHIDHNATNTTPTIRNQSIQYFPTPSADNSTDHFSNIPYDPYGIISSNPSHSNQLPLPYPPSHNQPQYPTAPACQYSRYSPY